MRYISLFPFENLLYNVFNQYDHERTAQDMEIKIATRQCRDDLGQQRRFHYFLTVELVESGAFCCENYGVRIAEEAGTTAAIPAITTSAARIDELMGRLVEHRVSPDNLRGVVEDWL